MLGTITTAINQHGLAAYTTTPSTSTRFAMLPTRLFITNCTFAACIPLAAHVQHITASNLAGPHQVIHGRQLAQADRLERHLDEAQAEKLNGLGRVEAVADVAAADLDHAEHGVEDGRLEVRVGRQPDADDDATRAHILCRLLKRLLLHGDEQGGVRAEAARGQGLDVGDEVLGRHKVDKVAPVALDERLLVGAGVDADDAQAHGAGVLARERAEAAAGASDDDGLAGLGARLLEALVDGDAGAQDGGDSLEVALFRDARDVRGLGDAVLLKGAVDRVPGQGRVVAAERLVGGLAVGAGETGAVEPLDADVVAEGEVGRHEGAAGDDDARALVSADERHLGRDRPVAHHGVQVRVAHAAVLDLHQHLVRSGLRDGDFLIHERSTDGLDDLGHLLSWDLSHVDAGVWGKCQWVLGVT